MKLWRICCVSVIYLALNKFILSFTGTERRNQRHARITDSHICSSMTRGLNMELLNSLKIILLVMYI